MATPVPRCRRPSSTCARSCRRLRRAVPHGPEDGDDGASAALRTEWHAPRRARPAAACPLRCACLASRALLQRDAAPILPLWRSMHAQVVARQCGDAPPRAWLRSMSRVDRPRPDRRQCAASGPSVPSALTSSAAADVRAWTRPVLRETLHARRRSAVPTPTRLHRHALHVPDESIHYLPPRQHLVRQLW